MTSMFESNEPGSLFGSEKKTSLLKLLAIIICLDDDDEIEDTIQVYHTSTRMRKKGILTV